MKPVRIQTRRGALWVPESGDLIAQALSKYGEWSETELTVLGEFIPAGATVIDGGAYVGTHTLAFLERVGLGGNVIAFEPNPDAFGLLVRNLKSHANVCAVNTGLGRRPGELQLVRSGADNYGATRLVDAAVTQNRGMPGEVDLVPVTSVDELALPALHFMKLDVEGMEADVLEGAEETVGALKPVVFCECNDVRQGSRLLRWARKHGYDAYAVISCAFNPRNFRGEGDNIFGDSVEVGILLCAAGSSASKHASNLPLERLGGEDDLALLMLQKPQYHHEVLAKSTLALGGKLEFPTPRALIAEARLKTVQDEHAVAIRLLDESRKAFKSSEQKREELETRMLEASASQASQFEAAEQERCKREETEAKLAASRALLAETTAAFSLAEKLSLDRLKDLESLHGDLEKIRALSLSRLAEIEALNRALEETKALALSRLAQVEELAAALEKGNALSLERLQLLEQTTRELEAQTSAVADATARAESERMGREQVEARYSTLVERHASTEKALAEATALALSRLAQVEELAAALEKGNALSLERLQLLEQTTRELEAQTSAVADATARAESERMGREQVEARYSTLVERHASTEKALAEATALALSRLAQVEELAAALEKGNALSLERLQLLEQTTRELEAQTSAVADATARAESERMGREQVEARYSTLVERHANTEKALGETQALSASRLTELEGLARSLESAEIQSRNLEARLVAVQAATREREREQRSALDSALEALQVTAHRAPFMFGIRAPVKAWKVDLAQVLERLSVIRNGMLADDTPIGPKVTDIQDNASSKVGHSGPLCRIAVDSLRMRGRYAFGWGWVAVENAHANALSLSFLFRDAEDRVVSTMGCDLMGPRTDVTESLGPAYQAIGFLIAGAVPQSLEGLRCTARLQSDVGDHEQDCSFFDVALQEEQGRADAPAVQVVQRPFVQRPFVARVMHALERDGVRMTAVRGVRALRLAAAEARAHRRRGGNNGGVLIIDHAMGGGSNKFSNVLSKGLLQTGATVTRLSPDLARLELVLADAGDPDGNTRRFTSEVAAIEVLSNQTFDAIHLNHLITYAEIPAFRDFLRGQVNRGAKLYFYVHDFFAVCPSWALMDSSESFCGVPDLETCRACLPRNRAAFLSLYAGEGMQAWRSTWGDILDMADSIVVFSTSTTTLLERAYPGISEKVICRPHEVPTLPDTRTPVLPSGPGPARIAVLGHLNVHKGSRILVDIAQAALDHEVDVKFHVLGSISEANLPPNLSVEGPYTLPELPGKLEALGITAGFMPSICAETFSFVTSEMMQLGLPVACFNRGAPAERVGNYELGLVLESLDPVVVSQQLKEFSDKMRNLRAHSTRAIPRAQASI